MGNFIFGYDFVDYDIESFSDPNSTYPAANMEIYGHLRRRCQTNTTAELTIVLDFGAACAADAIILDDVNFTSAYVAGHTADVWTDPDYAEELITISKDVRRDRYSVYHALTAFNYRYMRIRVPNQTETDALSAFRIGRLVVLDTTITLGQNPGYGYKMLSDAPVHLNEFRSGGHEAILMGEYLEWRGTFEWDAMDDTHESDIWTLNALKRNEYIAFYENDSNTSQVYICRRTGAIEVTDRAPSVVQIGSVTMREVI